VLFSTRSYCDSLDVYNICYTTPAPLTNFAHVYSSQIIADTTNWTTISGSFIADSAYQYIILGNLFDYAHTNDSLLYGNTSCFGSFVYYYVDDIYVSTDSVTGIPQNLLENTINISPNPANNIINLTFQNKNFNAIITISDLHGIFQKKYFSSNQNLLIDTRDFKSGLFLVNIEFTSGIKITKKLIIIH
jgi:hypothetical protein